VTQAARRRRGSGCAGAVAVAAGGGGANNMVNMQKLQNMHIIQYSNCFANYALYVQT
jgi:hypothetical protein